MTTEVVAASKGSLSALLGASKAFVVAHPIGTAMVTGAVVGIASYATITGRWRRRKARKAAQAEIPQTA